MLESLPLPRLSARCRQNALLLCKEYGLKSVAFPAISCGIFGYPTDKAAEVSRPVMPMKSILGMMSIQTGYNRLWVGYNSVWWLDENIETHHMAAVVFPVWSCQNRRTAYALRRVESAKSVVYLRMDAPPTLNETCDLNLSNNLLSSFYQ